MSTISTIRWTSTSVLPVVPNPTTMPGQMMPSADIKTGPIPPITPPVNPFATAPVITPTKPDQLSLQTAAIATYYNKMLERAHGQSKTAVITKYGLIALETLNTLRPSVKQTLNKPYLKSMDNGTISGRTILSLIKEGALQRPECVLTSHYMAQMLGAYETECKIIPFTKSFKTTETADAISGGPNPDDQNPGDGQQQDQPHQDGEQPTPVGTIDETAAAEALQALEVAFNELESLGLIRIEAQHDTQLLHPFSQKKAGEEAMFETLMRRIRAKQPAINVYNEHSEDLKRIRNNIFVLNTIFFIEDKVGPISGWDVLGLIVEGQRRMLGDMPIASLAAFFGDMNEKAVRNAVFDLVSKLDVIEYTDEEKEHVRPRVYAEAALRLRR